VEKDDTLKLGLFTPVFGQLNFEGLLREVARYPQIQALEIGTGGFPGTPHIDVDACLANPDVARDYVARIADAGLIISAFSCHSNPLHPNAATATEADQLFRKTVLLAERMHVPVVVTFSGCPGGGPDDRVPNWITTPWPPEYLEALTWQWEKKLIPYWSDAAQFAADHGIKVALEAHPGFCVYNPETLLNLRAATNPSLGINLDPSHLYWQGMDIPAVIHTLGDAIFHFHAKDVTLNPQQVAQNGVLDGKSYTRMQERSWLFRSVGWGHGQVEWRAIAAALRLAGYDYVMSIEHEDALASIDEGLNSAVDFLSKIILKDPPTKAWWT
jgi:sugar phosphate isomerase/epimerase